MKNFLDHARETSTCTLLQEGPFLIGFGKAEGSLAKFQKEFPNLKFYGVKQTHSDIARTYSPGDLSDSREGDAIISAAANVAIYVKSADCTPVLIFDSTTGTMAAIHAGWRGVANRITFKTVEKMIAEFAVKPSDLRIFIGPHIQFSSFEVDEDVAIKLSQSVQQMPPQFMQKKADKFFVNLTALICEQLREIGAAQIYNLDRDTLTDPTYHSYRRDKSQAGRQISFIARKL